MPTPAPNNRPHDEGVAAFRGVCFALVPALMIWLLIAAIALPLIPR